MIFRNCWPAQRNHDERHGSNVPTLFNISKGVSMLKEFTDSDDAYQRWASTHPKGFVINTTRSKLPSYMHLHKVTCRHVRVRTSNQVPGGFTERQYIKICGETKDELREWALKHGCKNLIENCNCPP